MTRGRLAISLTVALLISAARASARTPRDLPSEDKPSPAVRPELGEEERYSFHFQSTIATQYHPSFAAKYSGERSLSSGAESATAIVSTLYADFRLWPGAELLVNPEISGGRGLSGTQGVGGFPNGIIARVGDASPTIYFARLAISQTIGLGGGKVLNGAGPNELAGTRDRDQLAITIGRLSVLDVFDANRWAHDPTERFFNSALFASGAFDYPADTRGYTWGVLANLAIDWWSARAGVALQPKYANSMEMDWRVGTSHGLMAEYEARYRPGNQPGAISVLLFYSAARMGSYQQVADDPGPYGNSIAATRADGRTKYGFAVSMEQQLSKYVGAFLRLSMNDGRNEQWAFMEIDRSFALGAVVNGELWGRSGDELGAAMIVNGLSPQHRRYLAGGGYGSFIGDGALRYGWEILGDVFYRLRLSNFLSVSAIYQPIVNPAYNQDRGPVHVFTGRAHAAF